MIDLFSKFLPHDLNGIQNLPGGTFSVMSKRKCKNDALEWPGETKQRRLTRSSLTGQQHLSESEQSHPAKPSEATAGPSNSAEVSEQPPTCSLSSSKKRRSRGSSKSSETSETSTVQEEISANPMHLSAILKWYEMFGKMGTSLEFVKEIKENVKIKGNGTDLKDEEKLKKEVAEEFQYILMLTFKDLTKIHNQLLDGIDPLDITHDEVFDLLEAILKCPITQLSNGCSNQLWDLVYGPFKKRMNRFMQKFGFCCGQYYVYIPAMFCSNFHCVIRPEDTYYVSQSGEMVYNTNYYACQFGLERKTHIPHEKRHILCTECYRQLESGKENYNEMKNSNEKEEESVKCNECSKEWHKCCSLYLKEFETSVFICPRCMPKLKHTERMPKLKSYDRESWPKCELSQFIENKVNEFLKFEGDICGEVMIRVLSDFISTYKLNDLRNLWHQEKGSNINYTYREKGIFAFQKYPDGNYVCFFGFYVQEYGKDAAEPNRDRVFISHVDSVPYFEPQQLRTRLCHEILCAYMEYAKRLDFKAVHLWVSPPFGSIEHIFNNHPASQTIPVCWYQDMANLAIERGIILNSYNIEEYVKKFCDFPPDCAPYFQGDYWLREANLIMSTVGPRIPDSEAPPNECEVKEKFWDRMRQKIKESDENFMVYTLREDQSSHGVSDPDVEFPVMAMKDGRTFFNWCLNNEYEFSTLRRAKYSTKAIILKYFLELEKGS